MNWFSALTLALWASVLLVAHFGRGRQFAIFVGVLLGVYSLSAVTLMPWFARVLPLFLALHVTVYLNLIVLTRPRMRSLLYRLLVSWPSAFFLGGTLLALPWAVASALGFSPWAPWLPYVLGAIGLVQSLTTKREVIDLAIGEWHHSAQPIPHARGQAREERPLRLVQISDPHLGPFMSVERLRRIAQRAVDAKPDLVLLTGDFLTMESQSDPELLRRALEPLRALPGRVFACHGNHDHEAPDVIAHAMAENGIRLLIDESHEVETEAERVQILGIDFVWGEREVHLARVCTEHARKPGMTRLVLLHDPGAFKYLPDGEADLVLAGHTHGGQVGLLSLGLSWTFLRLFGIKIPDHGFWARGKDRMWVHRGTGHYGFPLRLGVPAEESVLRVHRAGAAASR